MLVCEWRYTVVERRRTGLKIVAEGYDVRRSLARKKRPGRKGQKEKDRKDMNKRTGRKGQEERRGIRMLGCHVVK